MYRSFRPLSIWGELDRMQREMNRLFNNYSPSTPRSAPSYPAINIWANEDSQIITAEMPGIEASARVRQLARSALASGLSIVPSEIVIVAAAKRVPRVWWRGRKLPIDLSFSHHGRFVACAWRRVTRQEQSG